MRSIGSCNSSNDAVLFMQHLASLGIEAKILSKEESEIWVFDDKHIEQAESLLETFLQNPNATKFQKSKIKNTRDSYSPNQNSQKRTYSSKFLQKIQDLLSQFSQKTDSSTIYYLSITCIAVSAIVAYFTRLGDLQVANQYLFFSTSHILNGEIWRIFTPMFLHFGLLHFLFNMLWLMDLGLYLEQEKGSKLVLILVICTNLFANPLQFLIAGPFFGGMSGVIYALFGYIWTKMKIDPSSNLYIDSIKSIILLVSFFMSFIGVLGNVANVVHTVGLLTGAIIAVASTPNGIVILKHTIRNMLK